jgi:hypothetical protein
LCENLKSEIVVLDKWQQSVTNSIKKSKDFMDTILNRLGTKRRRSASIEHGTLPPTKIRKTNGEVNDDSDVSSLTSATSNTSSPDTDNFSTIKTMLDACKKRINSCQLLLEIQSHLEFLHQYFACFQDSTIIVNDTNLVMDRTKLEIMIKTCLDRRGNPCSIMNEMWYGRSYEVSNKNEKKKKNNNSGDEGCSSNTVINNGLRSFDILERHIKLGASWTVDKIVSYVLDAENLDKLCSLYKLKTIPSLNDKLDFNDWCLRCEELFQRDSLEIVKNKLPFLSNATTTTATVSPDQENIKKKLLDSRDKLQKMAAYWMTHEFCLPRTTNLEGDMSVVKMSSFFYQNAIKSATERGWTFSDFMKKCTDYMIDGTLYDVQKLLEERQYTDKDEVPIEWAIYGRQMNPKENVVNGWVDLYSMSSNIEQGDLPILCDTTRFNLLSERPEFVRLIKKQQRRRETVWKRTFPSLHNG